MEKSSWWERQNVFVKTIFIVLIIGWTVSGIFGAISLFSGNIDVEKTYAGIILGIIGVLTTFVVVSNFAQVSEAKREIKHEFNKKINDSSRETKRILSKHTNSEIKKAKLELTVEARIEIENLKKELEVNFFRTQSELFNVISYYDVDDSLEEKYRTSAMILAIQALNLSTNVIHKNMFDGCCKYIIHNFHDKKTVLDKSEYDELKSFLDYENFNNDYKDGFNEVLKSIDIIKLPPHS